MIKRIKPIREELNLTQEEMAMLLNISRSQWALYELDLRNLSTMGMLRESQAERFLTILKINPPKHSPELEELKSKRVKFIADAVRINVINQRVCDRKIDRLKKDYESALKLFQLVDFASQNAEREDAIHLKALEVLKGKALKALDKNGPLQLLKLELQQKKLKQEESLLTQTLK